MVNEDFRGGEKPVSGNKHSGAETKSASTLELLGGRLCLDFANTVEPRHGDRQREYLKSYPDLVRWARHASVLTEDEARQLLEAAKRHRSEAEAVFGEAVALRETIYRIFAAIAQGTDPGVADLDTLTVAYREAAAHSRIVPEAEGFGWAWVEGGDMLRRPLWPVARSATELLASEELRRVKECPTDEGGCAWLFFDRSKNNSRRWCSMEDCGSSAKMRRFYARKRMGKQRQTDRVLTNEPAADPTAER